MTAQTTSTSTPSFDERPRELNARFSDLLASEWIKLWSLRSIPWAFAGTVAVILTITVTGAIADSGHYSGNDEQGKAYFRAFGTVSATFNTGAATMLIVGAGAIGAIAVLGEYTTGMIRTTFTAVPARRSVMAAKVAVTVAAATALGVAAALLSYGAAQTVLSGQGVAVGLGHPGITRLIIASAALAPVAALVGMGLAAVIRHSVLTIVVTIALLFVIPSVINGQSHFGASLLHMTILQAWRRIGYDQAVGEMWPWTTGGAYIVLVVWALVAAALAVLTPNHRDQ
ncbi:ABC transporter permease [Streptomyces sp. IBSBF 2953]|uniref:ABC transporter permease n=1 Tax=Streptomyces TaxID=1883 RepID=UPI00211A709D|nr:ABC transporter permease [Streptomyces scabiei]MCQ9178181.1 ABC transporter permease [Streptomyces hayashii]MDX3117045.1 ABC transporter permease [Streptomyces scabiei]